MVEVVSLTKYPISDVPITTVGLAYGCSTTSGLSIVDCTMADGCTSVHCCGPSLHHLAIAGPAFAHLGRHIINRVRGPHRWQHCDKLHDLLERRSPMRFIWCAVCVCVCVQCMKRFLFVRSRSRYVPHCKEHAIQNRKALLEEITIFKRVY